jgi:tetratricopeptide (TPR) repeat protein
VKKPQEILAEFRKKLDTIPDKKNKVEEILDFALTYGDSFASHIIEILEEGIQYSKDINYTGGEVICFFNLIFFGGMTQGQLNQKYSCTIEELYEMIEKIKHDEDWYPLGLNLLAFFHWFRGEYEKGFDIMFAATKLPHKKDYFGLAWNTFGLGVFFFDTKDLENSKLYFQKALDMFKLSTQEYGQARAANGLASVAIAQNKPEHALPHLQFATEIYRNLNHHSGLSRAVNDWGLLEKTNKNYNKAIELLKESIEVRKDINHLQGLITSYTELGEVYLEIKEYPLALEQLQQGLELALLVKTLQKQMRIYKLLYDTYKELKNTDLALENFEKYYEIRSKLLSDEASNNIKKIQTKFEKEKSEKEAEIERLKNVELKTAYGEIEEKNKNITDSIRYAKRIQISLLPTEIYIEKNIERLKKNTN